MPTTRASARLVGSAARGLDVQTTGGAVTGSQAKRKIKRNATEEASPQTEIKKRARKASANTTTVGQSSGATVTAVDQAADLPATLEDTDSIVPAVLTFSLDEAKRHLINVDHRFKDVFNKKACKPYENLERFHPFQALSTSILGQQISTLAARSIIHRFRRLYDLSLPEKPGETWQSDSFPTPAQVAVTDLTVLKTAGLSTRKAEYVQDLAKRFADGRLSTHKILSASDDELAEMLIAVRGIGRWTVDMFAIFSLRRPDILPVGDLGVQRGVARWFLALHSSSDPCSISPEKIDRLLRKSEGEDDADGDDLPVIGEKVNPGPSLPLVEQKVDGLPSAFTTPISKTLKEVGSTRIQPLPETLSISELRSRMSGKKKIKGALLTPPEMEALTDDWRPYRSIGVYYMWSLAASTE